MIVASRTAHEVAISFSTVDNFGTSMSPTKRVDKNASSPAILPLAKSLQFYWYSGHVLSVVCFVCSFLLGFFSPSKSLTFYRYSLFFEFISYGIVVKQSHFNKRKSVRNQLLKDENVQYLLFATVLIMSSYVIGPLSGSLYSYVIFSFFHSIAYFQTHILEALPISLNAQAAINSRITFLTENYNQQALFFASAAEVMILSNFFWVIPGVLFLIFRNPLKTVVKLLTFAASIVFVKLRYNDSQYTKAVVQQFDMRITTLLSHPAVPQPVARFYNNTFKDFVVKYIGPVRVSISKDVKKSQ